MSAKTQKKVGLYVDNADILEELIDEADATRMQDTYGRRSLYQPSKSKSIKSRAVSPKENHAKLLKEQKEKERRQIDIATKQNIEKSINDNYERQEKAFPIMLANVDKSISFLETIDKNLDLIDNTKKNKTRRQFDDWNANVHGAIQKIISQKIDRVDAKTLNRSRNDDFDKFLNITNRKSAIFNDIIIESEYDPLEPNRRCIKAKAGYLKDPVKIDVQKAESESSMLGIKKTKQKLGKDTLPVELWQSGKIEATPYGSFAKMMGSTGGNKDKKNQTMQSKVPFDHFNFPKGKEAIDKEMPRGKRIHPKTIYANPENAFN